MYIEGALMNKSRNIALTTFIISKLRDRVCVIKCKCCKEVDNFFTIEFYNPVHLHCQLLLKVDHYNQILVVKICYLVLQ